METEEIAGTFQVAGVTPGFHQGLAEVSRLLDSTPYAAGSSDTIDHTTTLKNTRPPPTAVGTAGHTRLLTRGR